MKKEDLKNRMVVETRSWGNYIVIDDMLVGDGYNELADYEDDLIMLDLPELDIVRVYDTITNIRQYEDIDSLELIWARDFPLRDEDDYFLAKLKTHHKACQTINTTTHKIKTIANHSRWDWDFEVIEREIALALPQIILDNLNYESLDLKRRQIYLGDVYDFISNVVHDLVMNDIVLDKRLFGLDTYSISEEEIRWTNIYRDIYNRTFEEMGYGECYGLSLFQTYALLWNFLIELQIEYFNRYLIIDLEV